MTTDRITSEEKQLWIEDFKLAEPILNSTRRTKELYKKYGQMVNGEIEHTSQELINVEIMFFNAKESAEKLMMKSILISMKLLKLNPNYRDN